LKVAFRKKFLKDLSRVPSEIRLSIEEFVFSELPQAQSLAETRKVERLKGFQSCYKARFGSYRVGIRSKGDTVVLERVLHRKEIYRFFP
jgi:mRNA interferase RelE/StbE